MINKKRTEIQRKLIDLKAFRDKLMHHRKNPDDIEEVVYAGIPDLERIVDPILYGEIPPSPQMDALFPSIRKKKEYKTVSPAPHESGLFLLPYLDSFRAGFLSALREELKPIQTIMAHLRDLERLYLATEREAGNAEGPESEGAKKEPTPNLYKDDYHFFKLLLTTILDNNRLGALFSEIGKLATETAARPGNLFSSLSLAKAGGRVSRELAECVQQYERIASLCENLYVCSIASWPSLSNYISMKVKALELDLVAPGDLSNFRPDFIEFQERLKSLISGLRGAPTAMQTKALYYAFLSLNAFLRGDRHPKDPFRLSNFSQVGAGKTYTTPIFLRLFENLIAEETARRGRPKPQLVTLYFTEANLCQNVIQSMIDIGVSKENLHIGQIKNLSTIPLKTGDCVVISRHEFGLKERWEIVYPLDILIRRGVSFMIVADESSFLKNSESGISSAMELLYTHLKKRHALWVDYRLSATPTNNDTGDFIYLLNTNTVNIAAFLQAYPVIADKMNQALKSRLEGPFFAEDTLTLNRLMTLLKNGSARTGILLFNQIVEEEEKDNDKKQTSGDSKRQSQALFYTDPAGAVLSLFYYTVYDMELFEIALDTKEGETVTLQEIMNHLGIGYLRVTQPVIDPVQPIIGLKQPLTHPGSRRISCLIPCLLLVKELVCAITYDRALNADSDIHFQINAKKLKSNLLESITTIEVLEKIRQFLNLVMFANLVRKARGSRIGWWLLRQEIEQEFSKLRMEFAAAYAAARGLCVIHKTEEITRKVHQGFRIVDKTEHFPYLAIEPSDRKKLLHILQEPSGEGILGPRLFDDLAQYFAPVRFFELADLLDRPLKEMTPRERDLLREETDKKRTAILEILSDVLGSTERLETVGNLVHSFSKDLAALKPEEDGLLHLRPSILVRYPSFFQSVRDTIEGAIQHRSEHERGELGRLLGDLGSAHIDAAQTLAEYGVIFKASESLNFPLVLRFSDQVLGRMSALFGEKKIQLQVAPGDGERLRRMIARAASFENFAKGMSRLARRHEAPLLVACQYRASQSSIIAATEAEFAINGTVKKTERYTILEAFDRLGEKMGRVLVATTKSIQKGFNIFYAQYGFLSEGMNNAEVRVQMAGRLRPLYPQHLSEIDRLISRLKDKSPRAPVLKHLARLKRQVKVFDVIAPEMLGGFPDIQAAKTLMLNTFLFQQTHQRSFPELFPDEAVLHYIDSQPRFNAKTVERFCSKAVEESLSWYLEKLQGRSETNLPELISFMEEEINLRAEENVRVSSYYPILEGRLATD